VLTSTGKHDLFRFFEEYDDGYDRRPARYDDGIPVVFRPGYFWRMTAAIYHSADFHAMLAQAAVIA
jgi:hypothetical protein